MWKKIKKWYLKQCLRSLDMDMAIFAIEYKDWVADRKILIKQINDLN